MQTHINFICRDGAALAQGASFTAPHAHMFTLCDFLLANVWYLKLCLTLSRVVTPHLGFIRCAFSTQRSTDALKTLA